MTGLTASSPSVPLGLPGYAVKTAIWGLSSEMIVDVDHMALAERIVGDLKEKRKGLGWDL